VRNIGRLFSKDNSWKRGEHVLKSFVTVVLLACLIGSAVVAQTTAAGPSAREPEITASGRGEVRLPPTYAILTVNVTTRATAAVEAAFQNARRVEAITSALRRAGLSEKDITTAGYRLEQNYEHPRNAEPRPAGFSAHTTIRAEVRSLENLGRVIDAAIAGGATGVSGIHFLASNTEEARRSAMAEAVRQAKADAEVLARAAGGSLGRLIALNSGGISQPLRRDMSDLQLQSVVLAAGGFAGPTNIVPAELNVTAFASGRWEFIAGASR
jgi:uncharacterized protein